MEGGTTEPCGSALAALGIVQTSPHISRPRECAPSSVTWGGTDVTVEIGAPPEHVNAWLYGRLVEAARAGAILTYSDVGKPLALNFESPADRNVIARLIGEISRYEVTQ